MESSQIVTTLLSSILVGLVMFVIAKFVLKTSNEEAYGAALFTILGGILAKATEDLVLKKALKNLENPA